MLGLQPETAGHAAATGVDDVEFEFRNPLAWYFFILSTKSVPHWVAQTVIEDALAGFAYLPQRDVDVVRSWLHRPYSI
jgi:hypothetical protein